MVARRRIGSTKAAPLRSAHLRAIQREAKSTQGDSSREVITACGREPDFVEWRFGDLVLTRTSRRIARLPYWRVLPKSHADCRVVLARCVERDSIWSTLIISSFDLDAPAEIAWPENCREQDCEVLCLLLPRSKATLDALPIGLFHFDAGRGLPALLADFMTQLAKVIVQIPEERAGQLSVAAFAMVLACASTAAEGAEPLQPALSPVSASLVERARLIARRNMSSPDFGPAQLAKLLAVSRSKLYRLLGGDGGAARFINRERLTEALRILATRGDTISVHSVATQVGFVDHSTFSRAFRRAFGCSPSEAREQALTARAAIGQRPDGDLGVRRPAPALDARRRLSLPDDAERGLVVSLAQVAAVENGMVGTDFGIPS